MDMKKLVKTVKAAQKNDENAKRELYLEYAKPVYFLSLKMMKNKEDAEDITQEVFITAFRKLPSLRNPETFKSWLNRIAANKCTDELRKRNRLGDFSLEESFESEMPEETAPEANPEQSLDDAETARMLTEIVDALPTAQRLCVYYYYYEELTVAEIAENLGANIHTVRNRLALSRAKIKKELERLNTEQGIRLYASAPLALTPAFNTVLQSFEVPTATISSSWSKIIAAKTTQTVSVGAGAKLALTLGGIAVAIGIGVGTIFGGRYLINVKPEPDPDIKNEAPFFSNTPGNTTGNIINGGLAAESDGIIYFSNLNDNGYIYKISSDNSQLSRIGYYIGMYINVVGERIYYVSPDNEELYSVNTDGSNNTLLAEGMFKYLTVIGDRIYYGNESGIFSANMEGNNRFLITDDLAEDINVTDDRIFYRNKSDGEKIYKIKTDGTEREKVCDDISMNITAADDFIYYNNQSDILSVYKIRPDGTEKTKLNESLVGYMNVYEDFAYCSYVLEDLSIYKIPTGLKGNTLKLDYNASGTKLCIAGGWIFYQNVKDSLLYKIRLDGTENQIVETLDSEI